MKFLKIIGITVLVLVVLGIAFGGGDEPDSVPAGGSGGSESESTEDFTHEDLKVTKGDYGSFDGTIKVTNHTDATGEVFVNVDAYNGEQHVAELYGSATMKPDSTTTVDLSSMEDFTKDVTDYTVDVTGW